MRRFLFRLASFAALQILICGLLLWLRPDDSSADEYLASTFDKLHRLESVPGERVILVGGSGVAFGFDCELLESEIGRPVVNMGVHASLPIEWYFNEILPRMHPGDTVVLIPEYIRAGLDDTGAIREEVIRLMVLRPVSALAMPARLWRDLNPAAAYAKLPVNGMLRLMCMVLQQAGQDSVAAFRGIHVRPQSTGPDYSRTAFNVWGDHVAHWSRVNSAPFESRPFEVEPILNNATDMNAFAARADELGVRCLFAFPTLAESVVSEQKKLFDAVDAGMTAQLQMPILPPGHVQVAKRNENYDTAYHLTRSKARQRTLDLAKALRGRMTGNDSSPALMP